jgi:Rps23 Pro-64 3,4-dihydroxylase Tpa1-like proline 4-hydroxylase
MFNRENIIRAQADFAEKRYCYIDNILEDRYIKALYDAVPKLDYGVWTCIHSSHNKYSAGYQNSEEFAPHHAQFIEDARGQFSYWHYAFWMLEDYHKVHSNPEVTYFNRVVTEDYSIGKPDYTFHDLVSEVTGFDNMYTDQPTYSYYDHTAWLNAHHDPNRKCAYIFYFNETWLTQWGGQLCILNEDNVSIKDSIEPFGNRLAIMDVSDNARNKHFISPVSITAEHPRYSLAGWFYPKNG